MEVKYVTLCGDLIRDDFVVKTNMLISFLSSGQLFITKDNDEAAGELDALLESMSSEIQLVAAGTIKDGVVGELDEAAHPGSLEVLRDWYSRFTTPYII